MPRHKKTIQEQYGPREAPPIGIQAQDKRQTAAKRFTRFVKADDLEQFELIKENLSQVSFFLSEEVVSLAKGQSSLDPKQLVSLCTALGISFDKLYGKKDMGIRPLSFPEPLLKMVKKGLELSNAVGSSVKQPEVLPSASEVSVSSDIRLPVEPANKTRYKSPMMQQAHAALCDGVSMEPKPKGINPRAEYRKQWEEKRKQALLNETPVVSTTEANRDSVECSVMPQGCSVGGMACAEQKPEGGGLSPAPVA